MFRRGMGGSVVRTALALALVLALCAGFVSNAAAETVDTKLLLMLDVSGSVSSGEFNLQRQGYVDAFRDSVIQNLILDTAGGQKTGSIAVALGFFSSNSVMSIPWTVIDSVADAMNFATTIENTGRPSQYGWTGVGQMTNVAGAISFATTYMNTGNYEGREVIDISGDGVQNVDGDTGAARDAAVLDGITVNAISIGKGDQFAGLDELIKFYQTEIVGGENSFAMHTNSFEDFGAGIQEKLKRELTPDPPSETTEPGSMLLLGSGLAGLAAWRRRRRRAQKA